MSQRLDYTHIAPAGVKALGGVYGYVTQSSLSPVLVDLVYLRISQINNCAYCLDMHTRDLLKKGQKIEKLALVQAWAEGGTLFDARERAALAWAETVTRVAETGVRGARARRSHHRDRPDECLQSHGDQLSQYAASCDREGRLTKSQQKGLLT